MSGTTISSQLRLVERSRGRDAEAVLVLLRLIRTSQVRLPNAVAHWGKLVLRSGSVGSSEEIWSVYEQVLIACLDVGEIEMAKECFEALRLKFGLESARLKRLEGMIAEAERDWAQARTIYDTLLEANGANGSALKRLVCVAKSKSKGEASSAAKALQQYLEQYQSEKSAWQELAQVHASRHDTDHAIFCYEELTLFEPAAPHWFCRLGELYATKDDFKTARKYFAHSLELSKSKQAINLNTRAAFGLLQCCQAIGARDPSDSLNLSLAHFAANQLKSIYTSKSSNNPQLVDIAASYVADASPPYSTSAARGSVSS